MRKALPLLCATAILVIIFGTIYATVQQAQRSDANTPQIQLAEDAATLLNKNQPPRMFSGTFVDVGKSLAPFTNVYNLDGSTVTGSGYLKGSLATVPKGILTAADGVDYHAVTWEPTSGVRIAAVAVKADKYYVVSGRSLLEIEKNESKTFILSFFGGLAALAVVTTYFAIKNPNIKVPTIKKKKVSKEEPVSD